MSGIWRRHPLLGITDSTEAAEFQAEDDMSLSAGQFYGALEPEQGDEPDEPEVESGA